MKVDGFNTEMAEALITIIECITAQGQRKKLLKNQKVVAILQRYGVEVTE